MEVNDDQLGHQCIGEQTQAQTYKDTTLVSWIKPCNGLSDFDLFHLVY